MAGRTRGSCRFATYYQVQFWNPVALAWKGVAKSFTTEDAARSSVPASARFRLVAVSETGREVGGEELAP